jgi:hypothetical protein
MCLNGKFFEEHIALVRTMTGAGVDIIKNCTIFPKSLDGQ